MLINLMFYQCPSFDDVRYTLNDKICATVGDVIWCDGFYVNYLGDMIEINVFDNSLSENTILAYFEPLTNNDIHTRIRIQQGRIASQFVLQSNQNACVC